MKVRLRWAISCAQATLLDTACVKFYLLSTEFQKSNLVFSMGEWFSLFQEGEDMGNYLSSLLCSILWLHYTNSNSTQCSLTSTGSCRGTGDLAVTMVWSRALAAPFLLFWPKGRHLLAVSVFHLRSLHLCSALLDPSSCGSQGAGVGQGALHGGTGSKWLLRSGLLCFFP